eukprot:Amastigsp_a863302_2.p3 type:complete len:114 gc:universal Amastigsp_a863302_2:162-503(+)
MMSASSMARLASSQPATSSHETCGFSDRTTSSSCLRMRSRSSCLGSVSKAFFVATELTVGSGRPSTCRLSASARDMNSAALARTALCTVVLRSYLSPAMTYSSPRMYARNASS